MIDDFKADREIATIFAKLQEMAANDAAAIESVKRLVAGRPATSRIELFAKAAMSPPLRSRSRRS